MTRGRQCQGPGTAHSPHACSAAVPSPTSTPARLLQAPRPPDGWPPFASAVPVRVRRALSGPGLWSRDPLQGCSAVMTWA